MPVRWLFPTPRLKHGGNWLGALGEGGVPRSLAITVQLGMDIHPLRFFHS